MNGIDHLGQLDPHTAHRQPQSLCDGVDDVLQILSERERSHAAQDPQRTQHSELPLARQTGQELDRHGREDLVHVDERLDAVLPQWRAVHHRVVAEREAQRSHCRLACLGLGSLSRQAGSQCALALHAVRGQTHSTPDSLLCGVERPHPGVDGLLHTARGGAATGRGDQGVGQRRDHLAFADLPGHELGLVDREVIPLLQRRIFGDLFEEL
jgi:hypothetical protein